jgi:hypothetical protein
VSGSVWGGGGARLGLLCRGRRRGTLPASAAGGARLQGAAGLDLSRAGWLWAQSLRASPGMREAWGVMEVVSPAGQTQVIRLQRIHNF